MPRVNPKAATGALAAMLAIATPFVASWEGKSNNPHWDAIGKVYDVCYGDTQAELRYYSDAECLGLLKTRLGDYARPVLARNPELIDHPKLLAAATSLSYNVGNANYAKSTVAKRFTARDWQGACDAFLAWRFAKGKEIRGLLNRRKAERALCIQGIPK